MFLTSSSAHICTLHINMCLSKNALIYEFAYPGNMLDKRNSLLHSLSLLLHMQFKIITQYFHKEKAHK